MDRLSSDKPDGNASASAVRTVGENMVLSPLTILPFSNTVPFWKVALFMAGLGNAAIGGTPSVASAKVVDRQSQFEKRTTVMEETIPVIASFVDPPHEDEKAWESLNDERIDLITKKYDSGLTFSEQNQLKMLDDAMTRHLDAVAPISTYAVDELMKEVLRLKSGA